MPNWAPWATKPAFQDQLGAAGATKTLFQEQLGANGFLKTPFQDLLGAIGVAKNLFQGRRTVDSVKCSETSANAPLLQCLNND